jgi:hypothetical protein
MPTRAKTAPAIVGTHTETADRGLSLGHAANPASLPTRSRMNLLHDQLATSLTGHRVRPARERRTAGARPGRRTVVATARRGWMVPRRQRLRARAPQRGAS